MVKITDIYHSEQRNKNVISMTVRRAHYEDENKTPDWPGSILFYNFLKYFANIQGPGLLRRTTHRKILREDHSCNQHRNIQINVTFTSLLAFFV